MRKRLAIALLAVIVATTACGETEDAGRQGGTPTSAAAVEAEGVPTGCGPILAVAEGPVNLETGVMDVETVQRMIDSAAEAQAFASGQSQATEEYLGILADISAQLLVWLETNPNPTLQEAAVALADAASVHQEDLQALQPEFFAFIERTCGAEISRFDGLVADEAPADEAAITTDSTASGMDTDDRSTATVTDGADADGAGAGATAAGEPVLEIETGSVGASGTYLGLGIEIGEIWRTNQLPSEALTGGGAGTDRAWVLVEARVSNDLGSTTTVPDTLLRWRPPRGDLIAPVEVLSPQGATADLRLDSQTSVQIFVVFPAEVGATEGAAVEIVQPGSVPEIIRLGLGPVPATYPVSLPTGDRGAATFEVASCIFQVETEVRGAEVILHAVQNSRWNRALEGRRFIAVDLAITLVESSGPSICPGSSAAAFQLETRLEQSNGDRVATADKSFDQIEVGATVIDRLIFDIAADSTSLQLMASANGEVLATWTDLAVPAP